MKLITSLGKPNFGASPGSFKTIWHFLAAVSLLSLIVNVFLIHDSLSSMGSFLTGFIWSFLICITQWTGHAYLSRLLDSRISWMESPYKRALWGLVALISYTFIAFVAVQFLMYSIVFGEIPALNLQWFLTPIIIATSVSFLFTAIGFFNSWKKSAIKAEKLKTEMMAYQYESLRNQINPHFLFNSFNVLSDLVYTDQKMAVQFIQQMSVLFRYVLDSRDKEVVPLKEEIDFLQSYCFLLKTRFDDKFDIHLELSDAPEDYLVPMTLQLLIENAVKHNEVSERYPLKISIRKNNGYIEIENPLRIKNSGSESKQIGLRNLRQQYSFFTDRPIEIMKSPDSYLVRVPILKALKK
jgi:sensor histidine kinase YesM